MSYADKEILHYITGTSIRRQVPRVVHEMDLEANIKFIKAGVYLDVREANLNRITSCRQVQR